MDQSNISASLKIRSVFFCYIPTSFSNKPFSYWPLNKYLFQANPVLSSDIQIRICWYQINTHVHIRLASEHNSKSTLTIPTAHSFSSKCSSTTPSPAWGIFLPALSHQHQYLGYDRASCVRELINLKANFWQKKVISKLDELAGSCHNSLWLHPGAELHCQVLSPTKKNTARRHFHDSERDE